ncbi:MAG: aminoglycoside phosphotransferase family protein [Gaiellaceae bacterium]
MRNLLLAAGFIDVRCYWAWPLPMRGKSQVWLPLDAPAAVASRLTRRRVLGSGWRAARRLGLLVPVCAVARKPGPTEAGLNEHLRARWGASRVSWLLLTGGARSVNKVVGLAFLGSEREPRAAVKFARSAADDDRLLHEAEVLRTLQAERPGMPGVPRVIDLDRRSGRVALIETVMIGRPLISNLSAETFPRYAVSASEWLAALAGSREPTRREVWWSRLVDEPLREFELAFGGVVEPRSFAHARDILASIRRAPIVFEHRDFSPWNVLTDSAGALSAVDWESSEPHGLPGLDLIYFLTYAAAFVDRTPRWWATPRCYALMRDPSTSLGGVTRRSEDRYCELVGLEPESLGPLRLLCWTLHARSEYRRLEADDAARPSVAALRDSVFLNLWRQELDRFSAFAV